MIQKYLDPKNDLCFKRIFGEKEKKRIPISFLNAVFNLEGEDKIVDLDFLYPIQPPEVEARKESIVDVLVFDTKGTKYIVQMEAAKIENFEKRAQYYASKTYCSHLNPGDIYEGVIKVVFLAITSYEVFPEKEGVYKSENVVLEETSQELNLNGFYFTFVELPKFNKKEEELETLEDRWYYFLKHANQNQSIPRALQSIREIEEAFKIIEWTLWSEQDFRLYERIAMSVADRKGALSAARKEGKVVGMIQAGISKERASRVTGVGLARIEELLLEEENE